MTATKKRSGRGQHEKRSTRKKNRKWSTRKKIRKWSTRKKINTKKEPEVANTKKNPEVGHDLWPLTRDLCPLTLTRKRPTLTTQMWNIFHLNDLKTLFSLTKILMKCHFKAMYYLFSREGEVTKSTIFMKKNRFWKTNPTLLVVYDHFLRVASPGPLLCYGIKMSASHTWPTWLWKKSTLSHHFCLVMGGW